MSGNQIIIQSSGHFQISEGCDDELDVEVCKFLRQVKDRKLMSKQDKLSLISASVAWQRSALKVEGCDTGIYFCMGVLPFDDRHLRRIAMASLDENECFSFGQFGGVAYNSMNPLITFQTLPNMSVYHISNNLRINGPYFVTYPTLFDFGNALESAIDDLRAGKVSKAIVGATFDQNNFLVRHHLGRIGQSVSSDSSDVSCSLVLVCGSPAKGDFVIDQVENKYVPGDPFGVNNLEFKSPTMALEAIINGLTGKRSFSLDWRSSYRTLSLDVLMYE